MKLIKCHIENFGKLSNFNYEFKSGLNTLKEENGFGKTTFASFIKAMFYGLDFKKNTKILIDRKKYDPWQGGAFGGSIEFEINDKKYKIERFFGKKEADDTFKLYDLETNLESNDYTQNIGEEIFKLNKEAYERSTFISGQNIETSMNDSINAKLGNILESENDINTSEQAMKVLEEAIKNYKKTGGRGEINEKLLEKANLEKKLEQSKVDEKAVQDRRDKINEIKQKIQEKEQERKNLEKMITLKIEEETKKAKLENYKILTKNVEESKKTYDESEKFFSNGMPEDNEIDTLIDKCLLIEKYRIEIKNYEISPQDREEIEDLKKLFDNEQISEEIINNKITKYNTLNDLKNKVELNEEKESNLNKEIENLKNKKKKEKIINSGICLVSVGFIILGIILLFNNLLQITLPSLVIGAIFFIIFLIKISSFKKNNKEYLSKIQEVDEISKNLNKLKEDSLRMQKEVTEFVQQYIKEDINQDVLLNLTEIKTKYIKYKEIKNNINNLFEKQNEIVMKFNELEQSVKEYLEKYFENLEKGYPIYAQEIKIKKKEYIRLKQDYEAKLKIKEEYEKINNIKELEEKKEEIDISSISKEEIEEKINTISKEINTLNDEKNYNKNQMEMLESNLDAVFDIENDLEELNQKINEMKENCNILEKTKKLLGIAKEQFSSHYLKGMKESFIKNLELINGKQLDINLDVKLNVKVNEYGSNKDIDYFSTGYKDLIYICMRLSLIDSLFEAEKPFIILDDPFVNLDENKTKNAMNLLEDISKDYQIIYFICHESRSYI